MARTDSLDSSVFLFYVLLSLDYEYFIAQTVIISFYVYTMLHVLEIQS